MNSKKGHLVVDRAEILDKERATGEFIEGPEDVEKNEKNRAQEVPNDLSLGFPIILVDEDDYPAMGEDQGGT